MFSLLQQLKLTKLTPIFQRERLRMRDVLKLNHESLKAMGVDKHKDRQHLLKEKEKLKAATSSTMLSRDESSVHTSGGHQCDKKYKKVTVIGSGTFGKAWKVELLMGEPASDVGQRQLLGTNYQELKLIVPKSNLIVM